MSLQSSLCRAQIYHSRATPKPHSFVYPALFVCYDLSELDAISAQTAVLKHNRRGILSLYDKDYITRDQRSIAAKLSPYLSSSVTDRAPSTIFLLTTPRIFGYVFNPVSFYFCLLPDLSVHSVIAEVNNTFGQRHLYPMYCTNDRRHFPLSFTFPKEFYVSPFLPNEGEYEFTVRQFHPHIEISIRLITKQSCLFEAHLSAERTAITTQNALRCVAQLALSTALTISRIQLQGLLLLIRKGVSTYALPKPSHPHTFTTSKSWIYRIRYAALALATRLVGRTIKRESGKEYFHGEHRR